MNIATDAVGRWIPDVMPAARDQGASFADHRIHALSLAHFSNLLARQNALMAGSSAVQTTLS